MQAGSTSKIFIGTLLAVALPLIVLLAIPLPREPGWLQAVVGCIAGLISALVMGAWAMSHGKRLKGLAGSATRIVKGDLSRSVESRERPLLRDEVDELANSLEKLQVDFVRMLESVAARSRQANSSSTSLTELAKRINVSAGDVSRSMEEMAKGAELQTELVDKTSTLISEMARSIQRTSVSAEDAARSSREASDVARSGSQLAGEAIDRMRGVFEGVESYSKRVFEFGERTKEIGKIVRVITEVAQQTHLLAINATIEAARAGEAGRGFAVVAEEIRQLAENTSKSADRIASIVEEVTAGSEETVQAVKESAQHLAEGRDQLSSIVEAMKNIVATVTSGSDRVQIISRLAKEQIAGAEQTVKAIQNISRVAQKNAGSTDAVSHSIEEQSASLLDVTRLAAEIVGLAGALDAEVQRYEVGDRSAGERDDD